MGERERTQDQEYGNEIHCYVANFKKTQPYLVISGAYEPPKAPSAAHNYAPGYIHVQYTTDTMNNYTISEKHIHCSVGITGYEYNIILA